MAPIDDAMMGKLLANQSNLGREMGEVKKAVGKLADAVGALAKGQGEFREHCAEKRGAMRQEIGKELDILKDDTADDIRTATHKNTWIVLAVVVPILLLAAGAIVALK